MVRGAYIDRAPPESTTLKSALTRYLAEVSPTKSVGTQRREIVRVKPLFEMLGDYAIVAITPDLVARYRDKQLALGKSNNTVRLDLALLSHLFIVAIQEWRMGLVYNPVAVNVLLEALTNPVRPMDTDLVFWCEPGRDSQRRPYEYNPAWRRALKRAGITDLRFHDLRHEAVSRLVEAGLGDQEVAAISGQYTTSGIAGYSGAGHGCTGSGEPGSIT